MSNIAKLQNDLSHLLLRLACLAALLMTFGPPAAADAHHIDFFEYLVISDIREFRPDVAEKLLRRLKKNYGNRENAEYAEDLARALENEIKAIKTFGTKKQLRNAKFSRSLLYGLGRLSKYSDHYKEFPKKTNEEQAEIRKDGQRATREARKIRAARRKAAEEKRQMKDVCAYVKQGPLPGWDNARQGCYGNWSALFCHTLFDGPGAAHKTIKCGKTLFEAQKVNAGPGSTTWDFCALVPASLTDECYGHAALMKRLCSEWNPPSDRDERACIAATKDMPASAKLDANAE